MLRWVIVFLVVLSAPAVLWGALPVPSGATAQDRLGDVQRRLGAAQRRESRQQQRAGVLSTDIAATGRRIASLDGRLAGLRAREARITSRLTAELAQLAAVREDLRQERARLVRLRRRLAEARRLLAARLVQRYKVGEPDLLTVVLNADGFEQLLEDATFLRRVVLQDRRIIDFVRRARADAQRKARELRAKEQRQQAIARGIQRDRDALAAVRTGVETARDQAARARDARRQQLARVQVSLRDVRGEVRSLQAVQRKIEDRLQRAQAASGPSSVPAGPVRPGSGRFVWPVNGPITSPFCERRAWESCHPGLDIGVPEGTPIRAADSGTVVLLQPTAASGGYGNYTCIQHSGGLATCYAHQSRFGTSMGARVSRGQVIGYVGNTGHSFGAHLHFEVRVNGAVTNPLNYL